MEKPVKQEEKEEKYSEGKDKGPVPEHVSGK